MTNVEIIFTIAMQTRTALTLSEAFIAFVMNATMVMEPTVRKVRNKFLILKNKLATIFSLKKVFNTNFIPPKFDFSFFKSLLVCVNESFY